MAGPPLTPQAPPTAAAQRSSLRPLLVWMLVLANIVVFGGIAWVWYWANRASAEVATIPVSELPSIDSVPSGSSLPLNFLLIGSDSREELPEDFPNFFGPGEGQRADVIMLIHTLPGEGRVQILSVPRDLKAEIPGQGTDKINAAYSFGGPDLMLQTVKKATGLPIHHYVEMDFVGFASIVDALGGVTMYFPYPARDNKSGLSVPAGTVELDGGMALAYARSRSYQEQRDGKWVSVEADDLGRIKRQQRLIFAIVEEAKRPSTITELGRLVEALGEHVTADSGLSSRSLVQLGWDMRSLTVEQTEAVALPVDFAPEGGVSYLVTKQPEASRVLQAFRTGERLDRAVLGPPKLQVLNGNGIAGAAGRMAERLEGEGYPIVQVGDADRQDYQQTLVIARPEELPRAEEVLATIGFGEVLPGEVPSQIDVIVVVGEDADDA
ncbi:MAG: LCP family protein [Actinomycetota bacterium]|nr:LCP family protein [Actinomycetota bacterium]